jgi:hypothetical protein
MENNTLVIKPTAVQATPVSYLKDYERTGYCIDACCVHIDLWDNEPHTQFECLHGVWRFVERIYLTRHEENSYAGNNFNIDGGPTHNVQQGADLWATLVCGDCNAETALEEFEFGPLECGTCGALWARTSSWSYEDVPADEVDNPFNVIDHGVFRPALDGIRDNGFLEVPMEELHTDEGQALGRRYQAVVTDEFIAHVEMLNDTDLALAYWKSVVAAAEADGTMATALAELDARETAETKAAARANVRRTTGRLVFQASEPTLTWAKPAYRDSAFGRIFENGEVW